MNLDKRRWVILAAGCVINLCMGTLYSWSVFSAPMAAHLNAAGGSLTVGDMSVVPTVYSAVVLVFMIVSGYLTDRFGPRPVVFLSGLVYGGGFLIASLADSLLTLCLGYGVCCGIAGSMGYSGTLNNTVKFFPDKRGLAGGLITASNGFSSVILPPVAHALITRLDIGAAFRYLGIAYLAVICLFSLLLRKCPAGYAPENFRPRCGVNGAGGGNDQNYRQMLKDKAFYLMLAIFFCGGCLGHIVISQASNIAQNSAGMTVAAATAMVSVLALSNASGRVVCGGVSDRIGRIRTLSLMFAVAVAGQLLLFATGKGNNIALCAGLCLIGLAYGAFLAIFPGFTTDRFGAKNNSLNYGIMFIGYSLAGMVGPLISGGIYDRAGNYRPAFLTAAAFAVIGLLLTFAYMRTETHAHAKAAAVGSGS